MINQGEIKYHKASIMEKESASVDVVILTEV